MFIRNRVMSGSVQPETGGIGATATIAMTANTINSLFRPYAARTNPGRAAPALRTHVQTRWCFHRFDEFIGANFVWLPHTTIPNVGISDPSDLFRISNFGFGLARL